MKGITYTPRFRLPTPPEEQREPHTPMVYVRERWQYKRLQRDLNKEGPPTEEELNELGEEGWQVAGMFTHEAHLYLIFKRLT
jgi:hypothetical protein